VNVVANMTRKASHSCNVDHDEMKNNFQMKDSLNPHKFHDQNQEKYVMKKHLDTISRPSIMKICFFFIIMGSL